MILTSITTKNDSQAVLGRVSNVATTGFKYQLQEQEANALSHGAETVAYLAWTPGSGVSNGIRYQAGSTTDSTTHATFAVDFDQQFRNLPFHFAGMQTSDGGETSLVRIVQAGNVGMEITVEEEASKDSEMLHTTEVAGLLTLLPE